MPKKTECSHDPSMDDETQHYIDDNTFWFTMRCDLCGEILKVFAQIDWYKTEIIKEKKGGEE